MAPSSKRGLVAPQNTFLENIIRKTSQNDHLCGFLLANSEILNWPIVYANEGFCCETGFSRSDLIAQSCLCEFMHGSLTDKNVINTMKEELSKKMKSTLELLLYTKQGVPVWFRIHFAPVINEQNESVFFLLTFKDITSCKVTSADSALKSSSGKLSQMKINFKHAKNSTSEENPTIIVENHCYKRRKDTLHNHGDLPKYHHEAPQTPRFIILHYSTFKTFWDWVILFLTLYTAIIVPYNVVFSMRTEIVFGGWLISDSIVDLIFLMDIVINFLTSFVGPGGEVISETKVIHMNYVKGWFSIDLLSCLPYDLVNFLFAQTETGTTDEGISSLFSILKVARLLRLGRVVRKLDQYIEYGGSTLFLLVCFFGLSGHWLACIWYVIGLTELVDEKGELVSFNWLVIAGKQTNQPYRIENKAVEGGPLPSDLYVASLYFTMTTLTSVGYGNIAANTVAEQAFCVVVLIFGALLYASIFGNVTTIIQQMYADTNRYHNMLKSVREFLKLYQIPAGLSDRIMDYIVFTWSLSKGIDTKRILNYFPKDMKADISVHLNRKVFNKHPAFRLANDSCLRALAVEFVTIHNAPGDMVYHQGESVDALNFVTSGSLEVVQDDQVVAILSKGDVFGDSFWDNESLGHSSCHVRALTYCDLNSIKWEALTQVLDFYEPFARSFQNLMRLTFNLRKKYGFRKILDLEKEKEEARKLEMQPAWENNLPEDHAVRQVFKKYKQKSEEKNNNDSSTGSRDASSSGSNKKCEKSKVQNGSNGRGSRDSKSDDEIHPLIISALAQNETRLDNMSKDLTRLIESVDKLSLIMKHFDVRRCSDNSSSITDDVFT